MRKKPVESKPKSPSPEERVAQLEQQVKKLELETVRELMHVSSVIDNNAAILRDVMAAHDAMIGVLDRLVSDVVRSLPEDSRCKLRLQEDGGIDYTHYVGEFQKISEERQAEDKSAAEVTEEVPEEAPMVEEPIVSTEQLDEGTYPEGSVVFGGDHG